MLGQNTENEVKQFLRNVFRITSVSNVTRIYPPTCTNFSHDPARSGLSPDLNFSMPIRHARSHNACYLHALCCN